MTPDPVARPVFDTVAFIPDTAPVVQRSEAYDPPEYRGWKPTVAALQEWQQTLEASRSRLRLIDSLCAADHLDLYLFKIVTVVGRTLDKPLLDQRHRYRFTLGENFESR